MEKQFNKLPPNQAERLFLLCEELGEAQKIIGKILRHGYQSYHPEDLKRITNRHLLEKEMGHILAALHLLTMGDFIAPADLNSKRIENHKIDKLSNVIKYLHHQGSEEFYFDRLYKR
jgi:hypothetical protein